MSLLKRHGDNVNLIVYDDIQPIIWAVTIPFAILCLCSCIIRLYTRAYIAKPFGTDDWFMLIGTFLWIGQQYIAWMWTILGGGKHIDVVPIANVQKITIYLFVEEFYYLLLQFFIKMSFLFFYKRTLCITQRFKYALYVTMTLVCCQTGGTWIFYGLQCIPIQAYFHPELYPHAKCISSGLSYYLPSVANVLMDVIIYLLPIYPLWHMQTTLRRRLGLIAIFTLGGGAVMVSLLRFIVLWQLANTTDTSYIFGSVTIVTSVEFAIAIITANTPGMAAFFKTKFGKNKPGSRAYHYSSSGGTGSKSKNFEMGNLSSVVNGGRGRPKGAVPLGSDGRDDDLGWKRTDSEEELYPYGRIQHGQKNSREDKNVRVETKVFIERQSMTSDFDRQQRQGGVGQSGRDFSRFRIERS